VRPVFTVTASATSSHALLRVGTEDTIAKQLNGLHDLAADWTPPSFSRNVSTGRIAHPPHLMFVVCHDAAIRGICCGATCCAARYHSASMHGAYVAVAARFAPAGVMQAQELKPVSVTKIEQALVVARPPAQLEALPCVAAASVACTPGAPCGGRHPC
jgi:hypothetical protein